MSMLVDEDVEGARDGRDGRDGRNGRDVEDVWRVDGQTARRSRIDMVGRVARQIDSLIAARQGG